MTSFSAAWGKADPETGAWHHLAHHSADVSAVVMELLDLPVFRARADAAAGHPITPGQVTCLAALAFLHDIGKLATGFQAKAWPEGAGITPRGHVQCGWAWLAQGEAESALAGNAPLIGRWDQIQGWFQVLFAHHGRPVPVPDLTWGQDAFLPRQGYDPAAQETVMGNALVNWFPEIRSACPPRLSPEFSHFFAGLLALSDWIGSDRRAFPFVGEFQETYWQQARQNARRRLREIGLDRSGVSLAGAPDWALLSDHPQPRPAQQVVADVPLADPLVILEAETGAGKTEAALWRFARLYQAGLVDALYFAVPTRAAARQLQVRVQQAMRRMFGASAPEVILAIPGQALAGEAHGVRLPDFRMRWDDTTTEPPRRWAAEHATRFLAAQIAVGTVDQVMLGGLKVKHAHLRGSALSRSLLVIDEVHASDAWMTEIQRSLVDSHLRLGGHAMLMSATLGAVARSAWRGEALPDLPGAQAAPYPAVWTGTGCFPVTGAASRGKDVRLTLHEGWRGEDAAGLAVAAAREGARVLVIRNTVARAQETFANCRAVAPDLVFSVNGVATLHHSRFAAEDRARLDARVEQVLGGTGGGCLVIGTQTLEQSLDIDADYLITDLCPMDVLLQRIGRLHRHTRARPAGYGEAQSVVLCPPEGLDPLTRTAENGLGNYGRTASLSGVYLDVPALAATLERIVAEPVWSIPAMNRALVEAATHPEALDLIAEARGWRGYRQRVGGKAIAETQGARLVLLDRSAPFPDRFPEDEVIRTRLGEFGVVLTLPEGTLGPFGAPIRTLALPVQWSHGLTGEEEVQVDAGAEGLTLRVGDRVFFYDAAGLRREEE
ncbi:CRISPR-associated helicase Cas3' [Pseudodonghicola flavimaris]|uniref:CRISPR-associated helicase Cas3 n=1 Tax=Pseudodonghicola flavimaris TaxID=3050036 RepID=A0ABT7EW01_9RHOB|nr:CRISPR-associated helicase Cas3' [Pseudodonghicola flavimaris]MDK3016469.1 CRISPR-associated helicase Cas3' [Pseudodonghicola flavimaris]